MDLAALVISIVALILAVVVAGFGILVQLLTYRATSEQTGHVSESLAGFGSDLRAMIERLQGQTDTMAGIQKDQFNTMLDAFVRRPGAAAEAAERASESALASRDVGALLESLEKRIAESPELRSLQGEIEELGRRVASMADAASAAARFASEASVGYDMHKYWVRGPQELGYRAFVVDVVDLLREVKSITDAGGVADAMKVEEWHKSKVMSPGAAVGTALEHGLVFVSQDTTVALTERGRQLLDTIDRARGSGVVP